MPTTPLRNALYRVRIALPWKVPGYPLQKPVTVLGRPLTYERAYRRLLHRHHVLGSAALLQHGARQTVILSSSDQPRHSVRENSFFRVASITKMATALAALRAVWDERLSLTDPIASCFPQLSLEPLKKITLAQLLSHTSGLLDPPELDRSVSQEVPFTDLLPTSFVLPSGSFRYSNFGFGLIGSMLEAVYHEPIDVILKKLVFDPLDMNATLHAASLDPASIVPITRIYPYRPGKDLILTALGAKPLSDPDPLLHYGYTAGAMYLDLFSLEKLIRCLKAGGKPLISGELGLLMRQRHAVYGKSSPTLSYGYGLLRIEDASLSDSVLYGHQGFAYGCADGAFWEESTGRSVIFLNGGASEARRGRLGLCNYDVLHWALREEMPSWSE